MELFVVVNDTKKWPLSLEDSRVEIISAKEYISDNRFYKIKNAKIFNLCKTYKYQSMGYYISLLAAARGHKAFPDINTIQEIKSTSLIKIITRDLDELIQKSLSQIQSDKFLLSIYFGKNVAKKYDKLSKQIFNLFQVPFLRVTFNYKDERWRLHNIQIISANDIPEEHMPYVLDFAKEYFSGKISQVKRPKPLPYSLAILVNDKEKSPPSDVKAIQKFIKQGEYFGFDTTLISKEDYGRIPEFDALFIRETTNVNHHTFRFAQRAELEGLVVLDEPDSILKCTNKVYLAELLTNNNISIPKTIILNKDNLFTIPQILNFPIILKQPDSAFSVGVVKVDNLEEYKKSAVQLLDKSELIIAQEFFPTDYDWRIGILNNEPLFACRYYMARHHWQIMNWEKKGNARYGKFDTVYIHDVPKLVLKTALKAAKLIGNGLYGVDLKHKDDCCHIIEINDNPSIDAGVEDMIAKDELYKKVIGYFADKVRQLKEGTKK